mmetsp:Transcript_6893/g.17167  ORF Transcript_6893/g.17167 Transcript_6893/m.17167 type:complete len:391 (-) Transcript_6893:566-1738(-)
MFQRRTRLQHGGSKATPHAALRAGCGLARLGGVPLAASYPSMGFAHAPRRPLVRVAPVAKVELDSHPHNLMFFELLVVHQNLDQVGVGGRDVLPRWAHLLVVPRRGTKIHTVRAPRHDELLLLGPQLLAHPHFLGVVPLPVHAVKARVVVPKVEVALSGQVRRAAVRLGGPPGTRHPSSDASRPLSLEVGGAARAQADGDHFLVVLHVVADAIKVAFAPVDDDDAVLHHAVVARAHLLEVAADARALFLKLTSKAADDAEAVEVWRGHRAGGEGVQRGRSGRPGGGASSAVGGALGGAVGGAHGGGTKGDTAGTAGGSIGGSVGGSADGTAGGGMGGGTGGAMGGAMGGAWVFSTSSATARAGTAAGAVAGAASGACSEANAPSPAAEVT